jgi:hypothetical protein
MSSRVFSFPASGHPEGPPVLFVRTGLRFTSRMLYATSLGAFFEKVYSLGDRLTPE